MTRNAAKDDAAAHALYDKMVQTMREAETLYFESEYRFGSAEEERPPFTYRAWLKKPNYARIEASREGLVRGVLVGDGEHFYIHWPNGRFRSAADRDDDEYERTRCNVYMKRPSPPGRHSIGHQAPMLDGPMSMTIVNLSTFHGYTDVLQRRMDGVTGLGTEEIRREEHDVICVSYMEGQRVWELWLSRRDHLPRKLRQLLHVQREVVTDEVWSDVRINGEMSVEGLFSWTPPGDWEEWEPRRPEMLVVGTKAPDFEFTDTEGRPHKLSDYRGQVVWLAFWRTGCPPCRDEIPQLQRIYERYEDKGFVLLGIDMLDDRELLKDFLREREVSFPNLVVPWDSYTEFVQSYPCVGVPACYIIDREGKVFESWVGYRDNDTRGPDALRELGLK